MAAPAANGWQSSRHTRAGRHHGQHPRATAGIRARSLRPSGGPGIAEATRRTGVSVHTLRYYERVGLGRRPRRPHQRRLAALPPARSRDWIVVCTRLRATGMPIKTIRR
ncbi:MerR family DNA-binding transcriptional regulator [Planotetraspora sp. A-T 1434]|nr:MerR family DNA-binding transcriptional regulator [Planotetraspora sp. A-T 1434]MCT9931800.1 MerR family DNA-binding transcriptional regulator [Planotetraspora sp. A-T 1434]